MYSREKVELFLLATEDGMGPTAAAKFAGVSVGAAKKWATGHLPHSYTGARCRIGARKPPRKEAVSVNLFFTSFAKQAHRSRKGGFTGCANAFSPIPVTA